MRRPRLPHRLRPARLPTTGSVCGVTLPQGLVEASRLPEPIFTPASKAALGDHDENISFDDVVEKVGLNLAMKLRQDTLDIYDRAAMYASDRGILLADTKLEFGLDKAGNLVLADEVLTPDSSRYWDANEYEEGKVQPSFDKQIVRNWLTGPESGWDRAPTPRPRRCRSTSSTRRELATSRRTNVFRDCPSTIGSADRI